MTGKSSRPLLEPGLRNTLREKSQRQRQAVAALTDASRASRAFRNDLRPDLTLIERPIATLKVPERQVRKLEPHHVRELAEGIRHFGFTVPILIDEAEGVIDGVARIEAVKLTGLTSLPCIVAGHLTSNQRRLLRLAANRLAERGAWALDELRLELSELSIEEAPIELTGFSGPEIDQILSVDELELVENGSLVPLDGALATARPGDIFTLGEHRIACGDATDPTALAALLNGAEARLILTDEPYNVPIGGHVSSGQHREFVMASGEMTADQFRQFNLTWIGAALAHLQDGGIFGSFIDWRGYPVLHGAAMEHGLHILNLIVWVKTNAGMGSLYRSQHELLPLFRKGSGPHVTTSSSAGPGAGAQMCGPILVPPAWAAMRGGVFRTIQRSSRRRCWRVLCST